MKHSNTTTARLAVLALLVSLVSSTPSTRTSNAKSGMTTKDSISAGNRAESNGRAATFANLPLQFIENRGQVDRRVRFYLQGRDQAIYFTRTGITFAMNAKPAGTPPELKPFALDSLAGARAPQQRWALKLDFLNSNPRVRLVGGGSTPTITNYLRGGQKDWQTELNSFQTLTYENLWPGIDLTYSGSGSRLKYQFVVKPGADPNQIKLAYRGASDLSINAQGQLTVCTPAGDFHDERPYSFQEIDGERVEVQTSYRLAKRSNVNRRSYSFDIGAYEKTKPLIIDPVILMYAGYIGGAGDERGFGIAVDGSGNAYVTGTTTSAQATFPIAAGADATFGGVQDAFVVKINPSGTGIIYATYVGGAGDDVGFDIAVDRNGNAYITGATNSPQTSFPVTNGPDLSYNGGTYDAFVAKLNPTGTELNYCGYLGGAGQDGGAGIAVDTQGNAYVAGATSSNETSFPVQVGPDLTYNGGLVFGDAFVAKLKPDGVALDYCGYIGGAGDDAALAIAIDSHGAAYVAGGTMSDETTFPVVVGPDLTFNGERDAFVTRVDPSGTQLVYSGYVGGDAGDTAFGIAVDSAQNAYIAGETASTEISFPVVAGPDLTYNGAGDGFVAKINSSGMNLAYCGYIGGLRRDLGADIRVTHDGKAFVTGATSSAETSFPIRNGPDKTFNGGTDAFVLGLGANGSNVGYCSYLGGGGDDIAYALALDLNGIAYVTGETNSTELSFPVNAGPDLTYNNGSLDAFVAKIGAANAPPDCRGARPSVARLWPPNHGMIPVSILGVTDADGDSISIRIDRITQDETTKENPGDQCPDASGVGGSTAQLRAERNGNGNGRVYTIYFTASDGRGGTSQSQTKVCVPHDQGGSCVEDALRFESTVCISQAPK